MSKTFVLSFRVFAVTLGVVILMPRLLVADDALRIVNDLPQTTTVWFHPQGSQTWLRPPLTLQPHETASVTIAHPGKTFVVVKSANGRQQRLGWLPLKQLATLGEAPTLALRREERTVTYNVQVPYYEQVERKYTVTVPIRDENGNLRYVQEERSATVNVRKFKTEQQRRSVEVPGFSVAVQGEYENLGRFLGDRKVAALESKLGAPLPEPVASVLKSGDVPDQSQAAEVNRFLSQAGLLSDVTFSTSRSGAVISIQPMDETEPKKSIGTSTVTSRQLPYGYYWVWARRDARETDRQFAEIVQDLADIFVDE